MADRKNWPLGEHTPGKHLVLRHYLVSMEEAGEIEFNPATRKKKLSYPKGAWFRFI